MARFIFAFLGDGSGQSLRAVSEFDARVDFRRGKLGVKVIQARFNVSFFAG
jgi:hypothetical protein